MTTFAYTAVNRGGSKTSGSIPADSRAAAMDAISAKGLIPVEIKEAKGGAAVVAAKGGAAPPSKVPKKAVEAFTRELANLLAGGLSLSRGLALLKREAHHPAAKFVWGRIHDDVVGGEALADAMNKWPLVFSDVYVAMIRAGEAGGFLHVVLQQISDFRQREQELTGKVKTALIYPIALATIATGVMIFLLTFFIPRFKTIFAQFGSDLPLLTKMVVAVSGSLLVYGPFVAVGIVVAVIALRRHAQTEKGRRQLELVLLKTPALGVVLSRFALVRFTRMLGTLLGAGVPLIAALKVARAALGNKVLQDTVDTRHRRGAARHAAQPRAGGGQNPVPDQRDRDDLRRRGDRPAQRRADPVVDELRDGPGPEPEDSGRAGRADLAAVHGLGHRHGGHQHVAAAVHVAGHDQVRE